MKVYFFSGLGADERVFDFLSLPEVNKAFIKWERPNPDESIEQYADGLIKQIDTSEEVCLVGVSFGGIIAQEVAKKVPCKKVIIISSIKSPKELGWHLTFVKLTGLYHFCSAKLLKRSNGFFADYFFSVQSEEESLLLKKIVQDTDNDFFQWAIPQLMRWKNASPIANLTHIHGTNDRLFSSYYLRNYIPIKGGGHFMIVNRADEISNLILQEIKEENRKREVS